MESRGKIGRVFHLVDAVNWPSIEQHGLLSTHALLRLAGLRKRERERIERSHRPTSLTLPNGVVIRDQKPMPPSALEKCLHGMTPADWFALLNSKVFFWLDPDRLNRQRRAGSTASEALVMVIDADRLLAQHGRRAALSPINTGNARRKPARRGSGTFVPYDEWLEARWAREGRQLGIPPRARSHRPVELTVEDRVADAMDFVIELRPLAAGEIFQP